MKGGPPDIQGRMVAHFAQADAEYGRRVAEGIGLAHTDVGGDGSQTPQATKDRV